MPHSFRGFKFPRMNYRRTWLWSELLALEMVASRNWRSYMPDTERKIAIMYRLLPTYNPQLLLSWNGQLQVTLAGTRRHLTRMYNLPKLNSILEIQYMQGFYKGLRIWRVVSSRVIH